MKIKVDYANTPQWRDLIVKSSLPEELKCLDEIAHNMWWVWNYEARDLFRDLDPELYSEVKHNPVMLLERLPYGRKEQILKDKALMKRIASVYKYSSFSSLFLYGIWYPLCVEDLQWRFGYAGRRLCERGFRL